MPLEPLFERRAFIGGVAVVAGAGLLAKPTRAAVHHKQVDPGNTADRGIVYRKMLWTLDQGFGCWSLRGTRYVVVDGELTPLWDMQYGVLFLVSDLPARGYEVAMMITQFYTDIEKGTLVRKFVNPITHTASEIQYRPPKVVRFPYDEDGPVHPKSDFGVRTATVGKPVVEDGQVWLREDHSFVGAASGTTRGFRASDMTTYFAPLADVANPSIPMVASRQMFNDLVDAPGWLGMGTIKASTYSRNYGYKVPSINGMSKPLRRLIKQEYPEIYKNPHKAVAG